MELIWWVLPALSGVVGLMLGFAGIGRMFKLQPFSGIFRLAFSAGFLGLGGVIALTGLNLQTYKRLTFERPVATLTFNDTGADSQYRARVLYPGGETAEFDLEGDEWLMRARVIKFKALSNILGFDSAYRLDRLEAGFEADIGKAERIVHALAENPGLDVAALAKEQQGRFGVEDVRYGSATYNPMADGLSYHVCMTQTGLIARPANVQTAEITGSPVGTAIETRVCN
ncbi:MAG: hypothetical protein AAFY34_12075 [Pseudomonadota bacterium]